MVSYEVLNYIYACYPNQVTSICQLLFVNRAIEVEIIINNHPEKEASKTQLIDQLQLLRPQTSQLSLILLNKQQSHQYCMLCGKSPLLGLKLNFYSDDNQQVFAYFKSSVHQQGYEGILHGGFLSALLDSSMCQALFHQDIEAVTADMNIRFLHEVKVNSSIVMMGKVISSRHPLHKVEAELYVDGVLMVKGSARFMTKGFGEKKPVAA